LELISSFLLQGTGKTLVAGALANECSRKTDRKVTFFSRKGADCYRKYVGESEERLRALFEEVSSTSFTLSISLMA